MTYWNYCDYRCEDCEHLLECPVALKEREQEMRAIADLPVRQTGGREFDPMEAVKESLDKAMEMVRKMAEERGVDLAVETEKRRIGERVITELPLVEKSKRFAMIKFSLGDCSCDKDRSGL